MTSLAESINVFHVDDDENLLSISKQCIESLDPHIEIKHFIDGQQLLEQLDESVDCVITDYRMPFIDGLELAEKIRENSDVPIIIFTGQGSEEVAAKAFSVGVHGYIQKSIDFSVYEVLINEIRNHVDRNLIRKKLEESENKYRTFLENSMDGITFIVGTEIKFCNNSAAEMLGYKKEEYIGMKIAQTTTPELRSLIEERALLRQKGETVPEKYESTLIHKDGSKIFVEFNVGLVEFEGEKGSLAVVRDISERVKYRNRLEHLANYCVNLNSVESLDSLYQLTYQIMNNALEFKIMDIVVVKNGYIMGVKKTGITGTSFKTFLDGPGIAVRAVNTGLTQLISDIRLDPDYITGPRRKGQTLSELVVPVYVDKKVFLVLNVESNKVNAFDESDKKLLEILAQNMGLVIERIKYLKLIEEHKTIFERVREVQPDLLNASNQAIQYTQ